MRVSNQSSITLKLSRHEKLAKEKLIHASINEIIFIFFAVEHAGHVLFLLSELANPFLKVQRAFFLEVLTHLLDASAEVLHGTLALSKFFSLVQVGVEGSTKLCFLDVTSNCGSDIITSIIVLFGMDDCWGDHG